MPINDFKEDEERTCSDDIGGGGGEELDVTTTQGNIEEKPEPNLDQVIDNVQGKLVMYVELVVSIIEPVIVDIESFQPIQPIVEPIQIKNPQIFRFQPFPLFGHTIETLRHINMFLKQVAQNAKPSQGHCKNFQP